MQCRHHSIILLPFLRNCDKKLDRTDNGLGDNPDWAEWNVLKFSWDNRNGYRDHAKATLFRFPINGVNGTKREMPDGFIWSWMDSERWPDARGSHGSAASYHFDQLPRFAASIYQYYVWTGDRPFLQSILPRAELVMSYLISNMNRSLGIPINAVNDGTLEQSRPNTYMNQVKSGWKDAHICNTWNLNSTIQLFQLFNYFKYSSIQVFNYSSISTILDDTWKSWPVGVALHEGAWESRPLGVRCNGNSWILD